MYFNNNCEFNILFVTNDDNVYGFGSNQYGSCGFGHENKVSDEKIIPELCKQNVISFFNGHDFVLAQTSDNVIFAWGKIEIQRKIKSQSHITYSRPKRIFKSKNGIENVSCSSYHALILTSERQVYGWGK